jgi:hypothetical protein
MIRNRFVFSIIIPLADGRIDEIECLKSWSNRQDFPRSDYQMILVSDGHDPSLEREVAPLLLPQDKVVRSSGHVSRFYEAGARAADGEFLVFSELHIRADEKCLTALANWLRDHPGMGACVSSRHENLSWVAEMEQRVFERQFEEWSGPEGWRLALLRGFAIPATTYQAAGGLRGEFPAFADVFLAAKLHQLGYRIGVVPDAWVTHINSPTLALLRFHAGHYALGEHLFRLTDEARNYESYFGQAPEWAAAIADRLSQRGGTLNLIRGMLRPSVKRSTSLWRRGLDLVGMLLPLLAPRSWRRARLTLQAWWRQVQIRLPHWFGIDRVQAFARLWDLFIQREMVRLALTEPLSQFPPGLTPTALDADAVPQHSWFGTHGLECANGRVFRWTLPMFRLRWCALPDATFDIVLETGGLRSPPRCHVLAAFWNGKRLAADAIVEEGHHLRFIVQGSAKRADNELAVVCEPLVPQRQGSADTRNLGLPVFRIDCQLQNRIRQRGIQEVNHWRVEVASPHERGSDLYGHEAAQEAKVSR